jgi:hypothetical protein
MNSITIEEFYLEDDIDTTKRVNVYMNERELIDGNKTYILYFSSSEIEFECIPCNTNDYKICDCGEIDWNCNFIKSNKILSCEEKDTLMEVYKKIVDNIDILKMLNRERFIDWIYEKVNDIENIYIEIDF